MKRLILFGLAAFLCFPAGVGAAILGNPDTAGKGKYGFELESEYIERDLEVAVAYLLKKDANGNIEADNTILDGSDGREDLINNKSVSQRNFLKISYGLLKSLDIYTRLGLADFESEYEHYTNGVLDGLENPVSDYGFAYGLGLKSKLYETKNGLVLGMDAQYLRHKNDGDFYVTDPATGIRGNAAYWAVASQFWPNTASLSFDYESIIQEWQLAIYVSKSFWNFLPYVGLKYSDYIAKVDTSGHGYDANGSETGFQREKFHYVAEDNFGIVAGISAGLPGNFSFNVEGRFLDENAISAGLSWEF